MIRRAYDRTGFSAGRQAVMAWLLLALVLRALLAPGMMPALATDAPFPLIICTPHGLQPLNPDDDGGGHPGQDHAPCLFAVAGFLNLGAVGGPVLTVPLPWPGLSWSLPLTFVLGVDHGWIGLARGPPAAFLPPIPATDRTG